MTERHSDVEEDELIWHLCNLYLKDPAPVTHHGSRKGLKLTRSRISTTVNKAKKELSKFSLQPIFEQTDSQSCDATKRTHVSIPFTPLRK